MRQNNLIQAPTHHINTSNLSTPLIDTKIENTWQLQLVWKYQYLPEMKYDRLLEISHITKIVLDMSFYCNILLTISCLYYAYSNVTTDKYALLIFLIKYYI